jgi:hypothetical protein
MKKLASHRLHLGTETIRPLAGAALRAAAGASDPNATTNSLMGGGCSNPPSEPPLPTNVCAPSGGSTPGPSKSKPVLQ